jgi:hypothetical protein
MKIMESVLVAQHGTFMEDNGKKRKRTRGGKERKKELIHALPLIE